MTGCDDVRDDLAEFALGLLDGDRRAAVLDHLAECPACRAEMQRLGRSADAVLAASPGVDPAVGFEDRVLARLGATPTTGAEGPSDLADADDAAVVTRIDEVAEQRRSRRLLLAIAAALLLVALTAAVATAIVDRATTAADAAASVRVATMRTTNGRPVGKVTVTSKPTAVLVAAPGWNDGGDRTYRLRVELANGKTIDDGEIVMDDGFGGYGLAGVQLADVHRVDMLDGTGHVVCSADFN